MARREDRAHLCNNFMAMLCDHWFFKLPDELIFVKAASMDWLVTDLVTLRQRLLLYNNSLRLETARPPPEADTQQPGDRQPPVPCLPLTKARTFSLRELKEMKACNAEEQVVAQAPKQELLPSASSSPRAQPAPAKRPLKL